MALRIAINGFGRIGRMVLRAFQEREFFQQEGLPDLRGVVDFVAINDLTPPETNAYLFKYDSVHGLYSGTVEVDDKSHKDVSSKGTMDVGYGKMALFQEANPAALPWKNLGVDVVFECSGRFTTRESAGQHIEGGASLVLISAPGTDVDFTLVYGVNHTNLQENHVILSNASCTTNCLAPLAKVLNEACGIECGHMTTINSYTGDQRLVDTAHKDLRRARAAGLSMVPTSTGAAKAVGLVLPELAGRLDGVAIRVPTPNVSAVDLSFIAAKKTSVAEINEALEFAANESMKGVLGCYREPLVSVDFNGNQNSSSVDLLQTKVLEGRMCRVFSWYDNEWGFSNRMLDVAAFIRQQRKKGFLKRN
jgi:glyceraldehyde 3-phosphate dehydrogenase